MINTILNLYKKKLTLIIKADETDNEKIKIRLFNSQFVCFEDYYMQAYELENNYLVDVINELEKRLNENVSRKKQLIENRKRTSKKETDGATNEIAFKKDAD